MVTTKTTHEIYRDMFQKWSEKKKIGEHPISATVYRRKRVLFPNHDDWKTSSKEDLYAEKTVFKEIDMNELEEHLETVWDEEIGDEGVREAQMDDAFLYQESCSLFDRAFEKWVENWSRTQNEMIFERG